MSDAGDTPDELDRKVLQALQIDARASFRTIAEVLGTSDQTVARRVARLRARFGLTIRGLLNPARSSTESWMIRVRASPDAAGRVATVLADRSDTSWVSLCAGGTEIVAMVEGTGVETLLLDALPSTHRVVDVQADEIIHRYYGGVGDPFTKGGPLSPAEVVALNLYPAQEPSWDPDEVDDRIVTALHEDGRLSIDRLAATTRLSSGTVSRRLNHMRRSGALQFSVDVDLDAFQRPVRTLMWLTVTVGDLDAAGARLASHPEVAFAAATTGSANLFVSTSTRTTAELHPYLTERIAALPGIATVRSTRALRTIKTFDLTTKH